MEYLDIVDLDDNIIGKTDRKTSYKKHLTNRIIAVAIFNNEGKILLQKRSKTCSFMPGAWDISAGGHVISGSNYLESAKKELKEEIGIECDLKFVDKFFGDRAIQNRKQNENNSSKSHYYFEGIFEGKYNGNFTLEDGEVELVKFFTLDEVKNMILNKEYIKDNLIYILEKYYF